ncbi:hypothetical protein Patl1_27848 [Pistacia atlantica]|uniref:Uncharacterized protein n=1 Tax=Pistacia atlantica TaxID=434234 RepID=A0ACC1BH33_9ROSI|nr:hypothetical protein Patl1_27848 [Pistacia atlantica]
MGLILYVILRMGLGLVWKMMMTIVRNYGLGAWENVESLRDKGCKVIQEVDTKTMADHEEIGSMSFHRILFNFLKSSEYNCFFLFLEL